MSDDPAPRLNPAKFRSGIVAGGGADPGAGVNDEADPAAGGGGVNSNVLAVLGRVLSSPRFSPLFLPDAPPLLPPLLPAGFLPRLDDDGVDAPIAKVPGARGVPLETSDAKDAFGENGFASAFAFAFVVGENGEGSVGRERFGEEGVSERLARLGVALVQRGELRLQHVSLALQPLALGHVAVTRRLAQRELHL